MCKCKIFQQKNRHKRRQKGGVANLFPIPLKLTCSCKLRALVIITFTCGREKF